MEIVEVTEQYCYTMIIGMSMENRFTLVVGNRRAATFSLVDNEQYTRTYVFELAQIGRAIRCTRF